MGLWWSKLGYYKPLENMEMVSDDQNGIKVIC
jgi:hypothetical protein